MAIKFKVIERGIPGVTGGGNKKYYASVQTSGEKTLAGLTKDIEKISTVSGADIRAVLYAMVDVMETSLANGEIVRLGDLGSLRVGASSEGKEKAEEVNANSIKKARTIFTPSMKLKTILKNLKFEKL